MGNYLLDTQNVKRVLYYVNFLYILFLLREAAKKQRSFFSGTATKALLPHPLSLVATKNFPEYFFIASKNGIFS